MPGGPNVAGPFDHNGATWSVKSNLRIYKVIVSGSTAGIFIPKADLQKKVDHMVGTIAGIDQRIVQLQAEKADLNTVKTDFETLIAAANF
jgi:hypothetical protein